MRKLFKYFAQGLLLTAPFGITIYFIYVVFTFTDNLLKNILSDVFQVSIPGLGLVVIIGFLIVIGFLGQTIIAKPFRILFQKLLDRVPILRVVYSALNDLFSAFVGQEKKFNKPVLVLVNPVTNLEKLGFLTEDDLSKLNLKEKVAVYFPHSYNFSGELYIVPAEQVTPVDISPAEVMKFIVSAGVSGWPEEKPPADELSENNS
jgi:uncharacterized membrane protein